jgi:SWI/SNF chromatin-remodeling complex subunit SWI1
MPPSFMPVNSVFDPSPYFNNLDPTQAAKQMAALTAASQARIANSRPAPLLNSSSGTNSAPFLGGTASTNYPAANHDPLSGSSTAHAAFQMQNNHTPNSAAFLDPSMSQPNLAPRSQPQSSTPLKQRQQGFLNGVAHVMAKQRNNPLPPALTGIPTPSYDPNTSPFKALECSEVGSFRLAGKDIELFKLWGVVFQSGGGPAVCQPFFSHSDRMLNVIFSGLS